MSAHTKKHPTEQETIRISHAGAVYQFPIEIMEKYRISSANESVSPSEVFAEINRKYTKPGALLRGIRVRENLTQKEMAEKIKVTQSDVSQMEQGARHIGRKIAHRIEELFDVDYRAFLE